MSNTSHQPVLYYEVLTALQIQQGGLYVDGTLGAGGHARGILEASAPNGLLLGLDLDPQAMALAFQNLAEFGDRAFLRQVSYTHLSGQLAALGWQKVDGILLDLGVSSMQLDTAERGFSFHADAPLDMRFDPTNPVTAENLVNNLPEHELADLLYRYGEERYARQFARAIVRARPLHSTRELADLIIRAVGSVGGRSSKRVRGSGISSEKKIHPATLTFQALRIAVNHELDAIEMVLPQAVAALKSSGRLAIIAFHSLEDRLVKQFIRQEIQDCLCSQIIPQPPVCICGHKATLIEINHRPLRPGALEIAQNPRARSARLRVVQKK